ncbi:outer membrane beta-barrel protein [Cyclobacterium jeungdonense]|uniref:Outer membrane beta-barrel protein n=1 Tax=Cyclobacterium jeungdonense TaxID=708087 RepID=A0ABT8C7W7_9BACT|nr:outer membrane beta-barrel protein [Cyclobacterium jeungdonense]MDN3688491.1 outer membrane beta-barrel protein [Cyclobacterium jeungdonense]
MKKILSTIPFLLAAALLFPLTVSSQNFYKEKVSRNQYYQVGLGLGAMYADNSGRIRRVEVKTGPSVSFTYGRKIHSHIDLRGNLGYQRTQSQDQDYFSTQVIEAWRTSGQALASKNNQVYLDLMPTLHIIGSENHTQRKRINLYMGTGFGMLLNLNQETRLESNGPETSNNSMVVGYIPVRGGLSYKLNLYTDIAFEGSILLTFSDKLDGNEGFNRFNDHPVAGQIVFRHYINPLKGYD